MDAPVLQLLRAPPGAGKRELRALARSRSAALTPARAVSRSYAFPYALVADHSAAVGVDIERIEPCDATFAISICTPVERATLVPGDDEAVISLWSAKEALAKALGDALRYDPRRLEGPSGWPDGRAGPWRARRLAVPDGYVGWLCWSVAG